MGNKLILFSFLLSVNLMLSQTIKVNDTDFSKGKLGNLRTIKLKDISKFHGHLCDGLAEGFIALELGLKQLYPDEIIDRTNTRIVSKSSPCLTDVAIYVSGGRVQYNTFYVDKSIEGMYVVQRIDNLKTISIKRKPNVKPAIIDEMGDKAIKGELDECKLEELKKLENDYAKFLLKSNPEDLFSVSTITTFLWNPKSEMYLKTDILNKEKSNCKIKLN
jgi:formylmethanofuran dehydrogenase subunit E